MNDKSHSTIHVKCRNMQGLAINMNCAMFTGRLKRPVHRAYHLHVPIVLKSGSLKLFEP